MEALRYIEYLKDSGIIIANNRIMHPIDEIGQMIKDKTKSYLTIGDIGSRLQQVTDHVLFLDALSLATEAGNPLTENIVLLGVASVFESFPVQLNELHSAIERVVPPKAKDVNLKAFNLGVKLGYEKFCNVLPCKSPQDINVVDTGGM
jgi:indolepyruvate ferredoxin oxidoreductase beta subunit